MLHGGFRRSRLIELDEGDVSLTAGPLFEDNIDEVIAKINVSTKCCTLTIILLIFN